MASYQALTSTPHWVLDFSGEFTSKVASMPPSKVITQMCSSLLLITDATRLALTRSLDLDSRGSLPLKGKAEPVELFAPGQLVAAV